MTSKNNFMALNREVGELKTSISELTKNTNKEFHKLDSIIKTLSKEVHILTTQSKLQKFSIQFLIVCSAVFTGVLTFGMKCVELVKQFISSFGS